MKTSAEIEVTVPGARITSAKVETNGTCIMKVEGKTGVDKKIEIETKILESNKVEQVAEVENTEVKKVNILKYQEFNKTFDKYHDVLGFVEGSKISMKDKFMQYMKEFPYVGKHRARLPKTDEEIAFASLYSTFCYCLENGLFKDFWRPRMDPCILHPREALYCGSYVYWPILGFEKFSPVAHNFPIAFWTSCATELGLSIGSKFEYFTFLAYLIKRMTEIGYDIYDAWYSVALDPEYIGNFRKVPDNDDSWIYAIEPTGVRNIAGFCDLGNVHKLIYDYEHSEWFLAGGSVCISSRLSPLKYLWSYSRCGPYIPMYSTGWYVLRKPE